MVWIRDCDFELPDNRISANDLIAHDQIRIQELSDQIRFYPNLRQSSGSGIQSIRSYVDQDQARLSMRSLVQRLIDRTSLSPKSIDLIVDFSTVPSGPSTVGTDLCEMIRSDAIQTFSITGGGCANFHMALWCVERLLQSDRTLNRVLMVSSDRVPERARVLFPLTILGDGASAMIVDRNTGKWRLLGTSMFTAGHLRGAVGLPTRENEPIPVDIRTIETKLMPVHFKAIERIMASVLHAEQLTIEHIDWFVYPNMSEPDRNSFLRAFKIPEKKLVAGRLRDAGHVFASDMIVNLRESDCSGSLTPGSTILLISAGAGFHWGCALLRSTSMVAGMRGP